MKHTDEFSAALHAAEAALSGLDVKTLLVIGEVGDFGLQIAVSDGTDATVIRYALRGAADALDGRWLPILNEVEAALKARGWQATDLGIHRSFTHPKIPGRRYSLVDAIWAHTALEAADDVTVNEAHVE